MPPVNEDYITCCCVSCHCQSLVKHKAFVATQLPPSLQISSGQSHSETKDICSTSTAPHSSAFSCVLTASGSDNPHFQCYQRSRQILVSSPGLSSHKSKSLLLGNYRGSAPGHLLPLASHHPRLTGTVLIARRELHPLIRETRLLKSSLPSPWIFTSPCHTARS